MKNRSTHQRSIKIGKPDWLIVMTLIALGFIIYANSLSNSFVWDDELLVINNSSIRSLSDIPQLFSTEIAPEIGGNFYRPIQSFSYALDYFFWGLKPFGYHLTNVLLHIANAILIYFILYILTCRRYISFITSLLFLVHPIQTEAVAYISGRADVLAAFFMFISLLSFLMAKKYRSVKRKLHQNRKSNFRLTLLKGYEVKLFIVSILFFILALLTKEAAVIFPLLVILCGVYLSKRVDFKEDLSPQKAGVFYSVLFFLAAAYIFIRALWSFTPGESLSSNPYPFCFRFLTSFKVILLYLKLLLFPFPLHMERVVPIQNSFFAPAVFFPMILLTGVLIVTIRVRRSFRLACFGIAWFFLALLPYLNWFPLNAEMAEHWLYLPSVGFFLLFALLVETLTFRDHKKTRSAGLLENPEHGRREPCLYSRTKVLHYEVRSGTPVNRGQAEAVPYIKGSVNKLFSSITLAIFLTILLCFSVLTIRRNLDWRDNETIYTQTARYSPGSPRAHYNLGNLYLNRGEFQKSIKEFRLSIGIKPWDFKSHKSLGKALLGIGKLPEAIKELETAVSLQPSNAGAHNELGIAYGMAGLNQKALRELKTAINLDPESAQARNNLASVYTNLGKFRKALVECERALKLDPGLVEANFNLGVIYYHLEQTEKAIEQFEKVIRIKPDFNRAVIWLERLKSTGIEK